MDILDRITKARPTFSKGQKRIADFITSHTDKAAFMTAAKMGATVGVSESTVVRFAYELGFEGYPELSKSLQQIIKTQLTSVQRISVTRDRIGDGDVLEKVLSYDMDKIRRTLEETSRDDFHAAAHAIAAARNIYVIGDRSANALARFIDYYFTLMFDNVRLLHTSSTSELYEQMVRVSPDDVLIGISFPRYSTLTVRACRFAADAGATVVAITDGAGSPLAKLSDYLLTARSDMTSFVDALVAPFSLVNALIVAVGLLKEEEVTDTFERLEKIWSEYQVYQGATTEEKK
ncbi:MAG: MurR/RpiR family transcriptional regulator [Oscillospiraceae bacterium]|nr:MurR/RpiR family transcriptional regulator [Oscillospiraceae bacterium]